MRLLGEWARRFALTGYLVGVLALALAGGSCVEPTNGRVEADKQVGQARSAGLDVQVAEGLAVVRRLEPGLLSLWLNAPEVHARVTVLDGAEEEWTLVLQNLVPGTEVAVDGAVATLELIGSSRATAQDYRLVVPPGSSFTLEIGPPDAASLEPWRFGLLSDIQEAIDRVQDIYTRIDQEPMRFLLGAGDLTSGGGRDELQTFERELRSLEVPYYTTLGNHELIAGEPVEFQKLFGRGNSSFLYRGVRFTLLDSASATIDPEVYGWIDEWLGRGDHQLSVVAMHIPPLDPTGVRNGAFASRNEAAKLLTRLNRAGVDMTLYGHIHSHYSFSNGGIPAFISGGGGAIPETFDGIGRHFMVFDVDPRAQTLKGRVVRVD